MYAGSPEERDDQPGEMRSGSQNWHDGTSLPKLPLGYDQQQIPQVSLPQRGRGTASFGLEPNSRSSKGPTLSNLPTTRHFSGRPGADRGVSLGIGQPRNVYPSSSQFFLTVIPPIE
jgi:hypothetical protein